MYGVPPRPRESGSKALLELECNWAVVNEGCVSREDGNHGWGRGSAARHLTGPPDTGIHPLAPLSRLHGHCFPGTTAHFQSLTPKWIQGCTAPPHPSQHSPGILAVSPSLSPSHKHVCPGPWHPEVLARNSAPIPSTQKHSLFPSLLSAWPCLDLTHPLVGCRLIPSPIRHLGKPWGTE